MPRKRFTEEQIVAALGQAEGGVKVSEVCRRMGVSEQSFAAKTNRLSDSPERECPASSSSARRR